MAIDILEVMSKSAEERMQADSRERFLRDQATLFESGRRKGILEGREEGRAEGEEQGIKKIVINMLKKGMDEKTISVSTDLSVKKIRKIKNEMKDSPSA